jgi:hypothetical protein
VAPLGPPLRANHPESEPNRSSLVREAPYVRGPDVDQAADRHMICADRTPGGRPRSREISLNLDLNSETGEKSPCRGQAGARQCCFRWPASLAQGAIGSAGLPGGGQGQVA